MNSYPLAQITIIWSLTIVFILYMIIWWPLKEKWTSRLALAVEIFGFGCMTIGFVLGIVQNSTEIDPATRNEIGFTFIAFTMTSTIAGGILALIQVLEVLVSLFKYLRDKYRRKRQVKPVPLSDLHAQPLFIQDMSTIKSATETGLRSRTNTSNSPESLDRIATLIKQFGSASAQSIAQSDRGLQIIEDIEKWCQENSPARENTAREIPVTPSNETRKLADTPIS